MLSLYGDVIENYNLIDNNSLHLPCTCKYFIKINNIVKLINLIKYLDDNSYNYFVLGAGTNVVLPLNYNGVVIKLMFYNIMLNKNILTVGSSVNFKLITSFLNNNNHHDLDVFTNIPGSIGGAIIYNVKINEYSLINYIDSLEVLENNRIKIIKKNDITYSYCSSSLKSRNLIVLKINFKLQHKNNTIIPLKNIQNTAWETFYLPPNLDYNEVIKSLGIDKINYNGIHLDKDKLNIIINENGAYKDIIKLIDLIKSKIYKKYNIDLSIKLQIIDDE